MPERKRRLRELEQERKEAASKCQKLDQFFHKSDVQLEEFGCQNIENTIEDEVEQDAAEQPEQPPAHSAQLCGSPTSPTFNDNYDIDTHMVTEESINRYTTDRSSPPTPQSWESTAIAIVSKRLKSIKPSLSVHHL
jgi:hypothetical protein